MADDFAVGATVGTYRIVRKIGSGGMGQVFLAEHSLLGRLVALKVLHAGMSERRDIVDRFFNEARATSQIADPGIVQTFDFGYHPNGSAFIVMEYLDGEALDKRLERLGTLTVTDALWVTRQSASSLAAAHAHGIVHRDLKPENMMMISDREVVGGERLKILDFGIAKLTKDVEPERVKTRADALLGTPLYMAPEQARGAGKVDHRADIYALGCVLYQMVVGAPPYDLDGTGSILSAHIYEPVPRPSERIRQLPADVDELIMRCLAKSPDDRFQSMTELADACDAAIAAVMGTGRQPARSLASGPIARASSLTSSPTTIGSAAGERYVLKPRRRHVWVVVLGAMLAIGGAGAGLLLGGSKAPPEAPTSGPPPAAAAQPAPAQPAPASPAAAAPQPAASPVAAAVPLDAPAADAPVADVPAVAPPGEVAASPTPLPTTHTTKRAPKHSAAPHAKQPGSLPQGDLYDDR